VPTEAPQEEMTSQEVIRELLDKEKKVFFEMIEEREKLIET
jgi:hypothetical protein